MRKLFIALFCVSLSLQIEAQCDSLGYPVITIEEVIHPTCYGEHNGVIHVSIESNAKPVQFNWNPVDLPNNNRVIDLGPGDFNLIVIDTNGCETSTNIELEYEREIVVEYITPDTTICRQECIDLRVEFDGGYGDYNIIWEEEIREAKDSIHTVCPPFDVVYRVKAIDSLGCESELRQILVDVYDNPISNLNSDVSKCCVPMEVEFTNPMENNELCVWDFGDGTIDTICEEIVTHTYTDTGVYDLNLFLKRDNGCTKSISRKGFVEATEKPVADFTFAFIDTTKSGYEAEFYNHSTGAITNYLWKFGGFKTSTEANPKFTFEFDASYKVILEVSDGCGCESEKVAYFNITGASIENEIVVEEFYLENKNLTITTQEMLNQIEIIDLNGGVVYSKTSQSNSLVIPLNLSAGLYCVRLYGEGKLSSRKILIAD